MERQLRQHLRNVPDNGADLSQGVAPAEATDTDSECLGLAATGIDVAQVVHPRGDVDCMSHVVVHVLALQNWAPAPGCVLIGAEYVDGCVGCRDLTASDFQCADVFTWPIRQNRPLYGRSERIYPRHVLFGPEVKARLDLVLRKRVAAAVDRDLSQLWRQSRWPLELHIGAPPARQREEIGQVLEIYGFSVEASRVA